MRKNMTKQTGRSIAGLLMCVCMLCGVAANGWAFPLTYMNDDPTDVDKLHADGNWYRNYWDDLDNDGQWDPNEPVGDAIDPSWINPMEGGDGTCWIATSANLLAGAGYNNGDAEAIYWDILRNMDIPWFEGGGADRYGDNWWVVGGWQQDVLNWYLENRADPFLEATITVYYSDYPPDMLDYPWIADPFDVAAEALSSGKQVGIVLYGEDIWHDITLQGYDLPNQTLWVTDSERDLNGSDLDQYSFSLTGPTGWSVAYDGYGNPAVDMIVILDANAVPEPATVGLLGFGVVALLFIRRVQQSKKRQ